MPHAQTAPSEVRLNSGILARDAWPLDDALIHLNHGSFGAVPIAVNRHQEALRAEVDRSPVGWFPRIAELLAAAREEVAPFVGARAADAVFVPNASAAATVVYNSLRLTADDEILVTDHGYGAVTMGATRLAQRVGARMRTVGIPLSATADEVIDLFRVAIGERTRLIVVDQITSPTGRHLPTHALTDLAHEHGVRVLVDGAHAPGLVPDAAVAGGGDWWFGNMHKWPCAPRGSAVLVTTASDREDLRPLIDSWGAAEPYPQRFDTQGTIDVTAYLSTAAAVSFIETEYGWDRTRATMSALADRGASLIAQAMQPFVSAEALPVVPDPAPSMRLVRLPDGLGTTREHADDLRMLLLEETGVETAFTSFDGVGYFRLSTHLYTQQSDFEAFAERCVPALLARAGLAAPTATVLA